MKIWLKKSVISILEWQVKRLVAKYQPRIVAITGSYGKTTTKQAVAAVLKERFKVLADHGNYNTEIGLPLCFFSQKTPTSLGNIFAWAQIFVANEKQIQSGFDYDLVVVEMGADHPGDIERFGRYLNPDISIITAVAPVHIGAYPDGVKQILAEKWQLARMSKQSIVNADNRLLADQARSSDADIKTYGFGKSDYQITTYRFNVNNLQTNIQVALPRLGQIQITANLIGKHSMYAVLAAAAAGDSLGLSEAEIQDGINALLPTSGRMRLFRGRHQSTIIDDSYNANADSITAAIDTVAEMSGRKIAIIGSINELGRHSESEHRKVGRYLTDKVDILITIGRDAQNYLADEALLSGMSKEVVRSFDSPVAAGRAALDLLQGGEVILVKGSQNQVFAEEAAKQLLANPKDASFLVRQTDYWISEKRKQFSDIV